MNKEDFHLDNNQHGFNIFYKGHCVYQYNSLGVLDNYYEVGLKKIDDFISGKVSKFYQKMINKIDKERTK